MRFINDIIKPFISSTRSTLVVLGLLLSLSASAQGWEQYYGDDGDEEGTAIVQTIDQGYITVGRKSTNTNGFEIYVIRVDIDGTTLWEKTYGTVDITDEFGHDIIETPDRGFVIVGETNLGGPFAGRDIYLIKIDQFGNLVWEQFFGTDGDDRGYGVQNTQDGGFVLTGSSNDEIYIVKTDANGDLEWAESGLSPLLVDAVGRDIIQTQGGDYIVVGSTGDNSASDALIVKVNNLGQYLTHETFGGLENDVAYDIIQASDGEYVIAGKKGNSSNFYALKLNDSGINFIPTWISDYGSGDVSEEAKAIIETKDNHFLLAGFSDFQNASLLQASILKLDNNGDSIWVKHYGRNGLDAANDIIQTASGELVITGFTTAPPAFFPQDVLLIKADKEGDRVFTNHITGNIFYDLNNDCSNVGGEVGIKNWTVKAEGTETYYAVTDDLGNYDIPVSVGSYAVSVIRPNEYWQACQSSLNANFPNPYETLERNFAIFPDIECTDLEVDISTSFVKACEEATYTVNYCNHGTLTAENIKIELVLSKNLSYLSGPPISTLTDSLYVFEVANLDVGACGSFNITVEADCGALLAETHCIKANITPNNICLPVDPQWDGSSLEVNGYCDNDSVRFQIKNVGLQEMSQRIDYIVVEDILIGLYEDSDPPALQSGETFNIAIPANGKTQRLITRQSKGHPGNSISPTIAIEGCVDGGGADYSTGYHTQFPEDDKDHFLATDCQENIPSTFDSQVKRGYPKGYGDSLKIANTTDLKYHIKFQNVGTDTAIRVVIRDTISPLLDPQTVRPGASSHDYDFEVYDNGILKFTFNNIMLIDSSTNESASHGFVKYRITQKPDNPEGSIIKNGAAIFFDYSAPLQTDSVCNIIGGIEWTDFIITSDEEVYIPQTEIKVYPNPVSQFATFKLESTSIQPPLDFEIYDVAGKLVRSERFYDTTFIFNRKNLPSGMYFYQISSKEQLISTGKIIAK